MRYGSMPVPTINLLCPGDFSLYTFELFLNNPKQQSLCDCGLGAYLLSTLLMDY